MASKFQFITEMYTSTLLELTGNQENWTGFLKAAAFNYKCPFDEQVLIYAQRPDATAVLEIERWNSQFGRWINRGAKGIAVFSEEQGRLKHYFDVSDTHETFRSKPLPIWQMQKDFTDEVIEALENTFGTLSEKDTLENAVFSASSNAVTDNFADYLIDLKNCAGGSFLEDLDELNIEVQYRESLISSIAFMMMTRLGIETEEYFEHEDFRFIYDFNTHDTINALGIATSDIAEMGLREISRTVMQAQKEQFFAKQNQISYDEHKETAKVERSENYGTYLQTSGRLSNAEFSIATGATGDFGEIRTDEEELPKEPSQSAIHQSENFLPFGTAPSRSGTAGTEDGNRYGDEDGESRGRDGADEGRESTEMGGTDEQLPSLSRGNSIADTDLQLNSANVNSEKVGNDELPAFLDEHLMESILLDEGGRTVKRQEIFAFFQTHKQYNERNEFLKNAYTQTYVELMVDDQRIGYKAQDDGLLMWSGSYLSRTSESVFSWGVVTEMTESLMDRGEYKIKLGLQNTPTVTEQLTLFGMGDSVPVYENTEIQESFFPKREIPQEVIDKALYTAGNDWGNSPFRILVHFRRAYPMEETVAFLKREFGENNGRGIEHEGRKYAVWFTSEGITIGEGKSVRTATNRKTLSYDECANRILELLNEGHYLSKNELETAQDVVYKECAESILLTARELTDDAEAQGYFSKVMEIYHKERGFPDMEKALTEFMSTDEGLSIIADEWDTYLSAYEENKDIVRFGAYPFNFHRASNVLNGSHYEKRKFLSDDSFMRQCKMFITEDELEQYFLNDHPDAQLDTYSYFLNHTNTADRQKAIKEGFGTFSGSSRQGYDTGKSPKGLSYQRDYIFKNYDSVQLTVPQVVKYYEKLLAQKRYPSQEAIHNIPKYQEDKLARTIYHAFYDVPDEIPRPYPELADFYAGTDAIKAQLKDRKQCEQILQSLTSAVELTPVDNRHYESRVKGKETIRKYLDGSYDLFRGKHPELTAPLFEKLPDKANPLLTLHQVGDFYEMYGTDANVGAKELDLMLLYKTVNGEKVDMVGFPKVNIEHYKSILRVKGFEFVVENEPKLAENQHIETIGGTEFIITKPKKNIQTAPSVPTIAITEDSDKLKISGHSGTWYVIGSETIDNDKYFLLEHETYGDEAANLIVDENAKVILDSVWNGFDDLYEFMEMNEEEKEERLGVTPFITDDTPIDFDKVVAEGIEDEINAEKLQTLTTPIELYRHYLSIVPKEIQSSLAAHYINRNNPSRTIGISEIESQISRNIDVIGKDSPAFIEAYKHLPLFKEYFADDVYGQMFENRDIDLIEQNKDLDNLPAWAKLIEPTSNDDLVIGTELTIDDRKFVIDSVDTDFDKVSLRDVTFEKGTGFPIFRSETIDFVRMHLDEPQETKETALLPPVPKKKPKNDHAVPLFQNGINYHIDDERIGVGTPSERYENNIAAIRLLKKLDKSNQVATAEEQEILSKYVGWGGLADCFDQKNSRYEELKSLLTETEYESARESTLTAFYTPPVVIKAIYETIDKMGFTSGNICDPACGIGHFMGLLPDKMKSSNLYGVELDDVSGRIARHLYQKASIAVQGFEKTSFSDNFFDVMVGNVPFGQFKVPDKRYDKHNFSIHDYFFARSLDKVRPGGVVAFVTSSFTMDKKNSNVRKYIAQRADLLGAIRLPNNTFKGAAGTEVTSDILFLQKRDRIIDIEPDWAHLGQDENGITQNKYFIDNPHMIMGEIKEISSPFGPVPACVAYEGQDLGTMLADAIPYIQAEITSYDRSEELDEEDHSIPADPNVRNFSYTLQDGKIYYRENSRMNPVEMSKTADNRIRGMIILRDTVRTLIEYQTEDFPDEDIKAQQQKLNQLYDDFTSKYGLINSRGNAMAFDQDSSYFLLCSLEIVDEDGNLERKADLFTKRTIRAHKPVEKVDTASEALAVSIGEKAGIDMEFMEKLTGKTEEELYSDLKGVIFLNPKYDNFNPVKYLPADEYLSGNVREKLDYVKRLAEAFPEKDYNAHIEALTAVQPVDLTASEISIRLGATWVNPDYIKQFTFELLGTPRHAQYNIKVHYSKLTGEWRIEGKNYDRGNVKAHSTYGTNRINAYSIIEESLNLKDVRIFDYVYDADGKKTAVLNKKETAIAQSKQEIIKAQFAEWIWKEPDRREKLCKAYNLLFNSNRPREYDGSHIVFSGMNPEIHLREHQVNAIAHTLYGGNTLLAHCVGAGKTFEMVAAAMESKRLGLCQKSLFVVPNHLTEQWASEFLQLYPSANILVSTKKDFETKNRKKFCGRIATGEYDAVIIGHSQFEKIPMSAARQEAILRDQLDEILMGIREAKQSHAENFTVKQMEKTRKGLEQKIEKLNDQSRKDDIVTFEELGVDRLFIDESHFYKNLFLYTKMRNVGGIAQTEAQKSSDLFMKCRYLDELTGGRGIVFATGTPISNSMVELYTIQRYLQYETLKSHELQHFDAWASNFGETVTAIELSPEGTGYRAKTRFAKFYNLPELMAMFKDVADIKTADMLNLPVPEANYHNIAVKPSEHQKEIVASLAERAEKVRNREVDSSVDNMLLITNDGRKLALDQRLINSMLPNEENSKAATCANNVYEIWEQSNEQKSAQMVFCDLSTPKTDGTFNVYADVREKLIAKGIPPEEISFIHEAKTDVQKKELFAKVRTGQVRVLLGSTQRMGAGTNAQNKLIALHHLDCPWRPSDLQQREGRIIRQGNENENVEIFSYVTEQTFDSYLYQLVEGKQKFISQIMTSKSPVRSAEDVDEQALSYAEIKALATGNPMIKEKMQLDTDVAKLKMLKANHLSQRYSLEDKIIKSFPKEIAEAKERLQGYGTDIQAVKENTHLNEDKFSPMVLMGKTYADKKEAGTELLAICHNMLTGDATQIGNYRGLKLSLSFDSFAQEYRLSMMGKLSHTVALGTDVYGNIQRMDNYLETLPIKEQACKERLEDVEKQLETAKIEVTKPFVKEAELTEKLARVEELNALLNMDGKEEPEAEKEEIKERTKEYER